jgi:quercetin dioxygenase-like cupin family protein
MQGVKHVDFKDLFEKFNNCGKLLLPEGSVKFMDISWLKHPVFEGVELKHVITSKNTKGKFSYHFVRIAPNKSIGTHVHKEQLETHEGIAGSGTCMNNNVKLDYTIGVISIFPINVPHEVHAGADGSFLFAKFIPALI